MAARRPSTAREVAKLILSHEQEKGVLKREIAQLKDRVSQLEAELADHELEHGIL